MNYELRILNNWERRFQPPAVIWQTDPICILGDGTDYRAEGTTFLRSADHIRDEFQNRVVALCIYKSFRVSARASSTKKSRLPKAQSSSIC